MNKIGDPCKSYLIIPGTFTDLNGNDISKNPPLIDENKIICGYSLKEKDSIKKTKCDVVSEVNKLINDDKHRIKKEQDLEIGQLNELYIQDILCSHFKLPYLNQTTFFHPMDFYCDGVYFEVKSRRNTHDKYDTTMIGYNKIQWIKDKNIKDVYFVFIFTDGNFYYKYNPEDNFEITTGGRWDRGKVEKKLYYYIPTNKLTKI
jgi:hypothetical protein